MADSSTNSVVIAAVASGILCLILGASVAYLLLDQPAPATPGPAAAELQSDQPDTPPAPEAEGVAVLEQQKRTAESEASKLRGENQALVAERDRLNEENRGLSARMAATERELTELRAAARSGRPPLAVGFGSYVELESLLRADWPELGGALHNMTQLLRQLAEDTRAGREMSAETGRKIGEHNLKLISLAAALAGKVPTNAGNANGEYTHPIATVNLLAAQLATAGDPLTDEQKARLRVLGDEYEKRWAEKQKSYGAETFRLQKLLDEAELKQWFVDQMFLVTTAAQKAHAIDPSIEGMVGLDLYSPGLLFAPIMRPLTISSRAQAKTAMKDALVQAYKVDRAALDGSELAFDTWLAGQALEPRTDNSFTHLREVMQSARLQLALLQELCATAINNAEVVEQIREDNRVLFVMLMPE